MIHLIQLLPRRLQPEQQIFRRYCGTLISPLTRSYSILGPSLVNVDHPNGSRFLNARFWMNKLSKCPVLLLGIANYAASLCFLEESNVDEPCSIFQAGTATHQR